MAVLLSVSLLWVASRPVEQQLVPAGWPVDPADRALFKGFVALWDGEDADLATLQGVYAEDAQLRLLWLDEEEVVSGHVAIRERIGELEPTRTECGPVPTRGPLLGRSPVPADTGRQWFDSARQRAPVCLWIEADRVRLHDCILPASFGDTESLRLDMPDASTRAEREALADCTHRGARRA